MHRLLLRVWRQPLVQRRLRDPTRHPVRHQLRRHAAHGVLGPRARRAEKTRGGGLRCEDRGGRDFGDGGLREGAVAGADFGGEDLLETLFESDFLDGFEVL